MKRKGFTLLELLVVISIISILTTLVTVASVQAIIYAKTAATKSTIKKLDEAILERINGNVRFHEWPDHRLRRRWNQSGWLVEWQTLVSAHQNQIADLNEAYKSLSRKYTLREMLPMTRSELRGCYWCRAQYPTQAACNAATQDIDSNGEVLYYALLNAPVFSGQRIDEELFSSKELVDTDGDGFFEVADAWGNPIRFYRWPTRIINGGTSLNLPWDNNPERDVLIPNIPQRDGLKNDPDDVMANLAIPDVNPIVSVFHDARTWHVPMVVSAGQDEKLGLEEPTVAPLMEPLSYEELVDNITNTNIQ